MNTKIILTILISTLFLNYTQGQTLLEKRKEKIKSQKIAFLTEQMELSVNDSQKFWPIYNEMQTKIEAISEARNKLTKKIMLLEEELTLDQKDKIMNDYLDLNDQEAAVKRSYHERFKKVISTDQLLKYYIAEKKFKVKLLTQLKENKEGADKKTRRRLN